MPDEDGLQQIPPFDIAIDLQDTPGPDEGDGDDDESPALSWDEAILDIVDELPDEEI